jgi:hypothetical protein
MSTVLARRVASTPVRTVADTWRKSSRSSRPIPPARPACASIASEVPKEVPIVIWGGGPRVRFYCVFDEDAITKDGVNEDALPKSPAEGDWRMSVPFLAEDVTWSGASLAAASSRVSARSVDDEVADDEPVAAEAAPLSINLAEFLKS